MLTEPRNTRKAKRSIPIILQERININNYDTKLTEAYESAVCNMEITYNCENANIRNHEKHPIGIIWNYFSHYVNNSSRIRNFSPKLLEFGT